MNRKKRNILIIEQEAIIALDIKKRFQNQGHSIVGVTTSIKETIQHRKDFRNVDLILMDAELEDFSNHFSFAERIYRLIQTPLVILASHIDETVRKKCHKYQFVRVIDKPFRNDELLDVIGNIYSKSE
jgi:two-component system, response regulator PdtaR